MKRPPNIVLTIADDQRGTALGCAGVEPVRTPHLDAFAAAGTYYRRAQHFGSCHGGICSPSRAMLHTGHPYFALDRNLLGATYPPAGREVPRPPTLGRKLRDAGYDTFGTGKWHNGVQLFHDSFAGAANIFFGGMADHWFTPVHDYDPTGAYPAEAARTADGFSTDVFAQSAVDYIRSRAGSDQPFFCYCAFTAPHDPRTPLDEWRRMYDPRDVELTPNMPTGNFAPQAPLGVMPAVDNFTAGQRDELLLGTPRDVREIQREVAAYYGMISHMDDAIGRIHAAVSDAGLEGDTIIIHTADHGIAVGQHGFMGKQNLFLHSVRVPLILAGPGIEAGAVCDDLVYQQDLHPTLCERTGIPGATDSFRALGSEPRTSIGTAFADTQRAVREDRYKLIEYCVEGRRFAQLFDLQEDPWETTDLIDNADLAPVVERLRGELGAWQRLHGDDANWP